MKKYLSALRTSVLLIILISTVFAGSALADNGITASGERYTDSQGNDLKTVSVEFKNIPAEYEGWQATMVESMPVCGVVTNGVVSCEFHNINSIKGGWLHLFKKGTDQVASFYVTFYIRGMKQQIKEEVAPPSECNPTFLPITDPCIPL